MTVTPNHLPDRLTFPINIPDHRKLKMADSRTEELTLTQTPEAELQPPPIILFLGPTSRGNTSLAQFLAQHHHLMHISMDDFAARNNETWDCISSSALFDRLRDYIHDAWYYASPPERPTAFLLDALSTEQGELSAFIESLGAWSPMFAVSVRAPMPSGSGCRSRGEEPLRHSLPGFARYGEEVAEFREVQDRLEAELRDSGVGVLTCFFDDEQDEMNARLLEELLKIDAWRQLLNESGQNPEDVVMAGLEV